MTTTKPTVGILGASGYAGGELLRLLARHPNLEVAWAAGDRQRGQPLAGRYPGLRAAYGDLSFCSLDEGLDKRADVLFLALPHGSAAAVVPRALERGSLLIVDEASMMSVADLAAIVALARRLAVIMHRIWVDGTEFRWTREAAAA